MARKRNNTNESGEGKRGRGRPASENRTQHRDPRWPEGLYQSLRHARGKPFIYERRFRGQAYRFSLKGMSKTQAIVEAERINLAIVRGEPVDWLGRDSSKSWAAMYADFLSWVQKDNELAAASRTKYVGVLTRLAHFLHAEGIRLNASTDFSERIARQYVEWREDTPVARNGDPSSQRRRRPKLRTVHDDVDLLRKMFERAREAVRARRRDQVARASGVCSLLTFGDIDEGAVRGRREFGQAVEWAGGWYPAENPSRIAARGRADPFGIVLAVPSDHHADWLASGIVIGPED